MTDPERLSIASDSELERRLLRSGRAAAPPDPRQRAILAATAVLGVSGLAAGSAAAGSAAGGVAAKTGSVLSLKWLAFFGVAGLGAMTVALAVNDRPLSSEPSHRVEVPTVVVGAAAPPSVLPRPTASVMAPLVVASETPPATALPAPAPSGFAARAPASAAAPIASSESSSVHAELGTLEQARGALSAGDPARALSILDAYASSYPHGSMGPEATVLRVEALVRAGDRSAAARVGNAFLDGNPQSPYAARIRSLLGASNP
jgi:hypothetical protein